MTIIFHIDVNSAFLSWSAVEELKNGAARDLRKINAIVGGDQKSRHGIVLAKSQSAKRYGIRTGEPVANAFRKCSDLVVVSPDHRCYQEYSKRLMDLLRDYTPDIEQVSVDECFMDFTGIAHQFHSPIDGAMEIKNAVRDKFGFTVNVGISTNKLLAKMASDFEKPDKVHTLFPEEIQAKMWPLPVEDLFMAGRSSVETLHKLEMRTIGDVAQADPAILELHLKSHGRMLWESANGIGDDVVRPVRAEAKGIGNSTTLAKDVTTEEEAGKVLFNLAESVGRRLRNAGMKAGMLSVEIRYHTFQDNSHQKQLFRSTSNDMDIYNIAMELFREFWNGEPIRLLGLRSSKLVHEDEPEQMSLFDFQTMQNEKPQSASGVKKTHSMLSNESSLQREKLRSLDQALDQIRKKYGDDAVKRGIQLRPGE